MGSPALSVAHLAHVVGAGAAVAPSIAVAAAALHTEAFGVAELKRHHRYLTPNMCNSYSIT